MAKILSDRLMTALGGIVGDVRNVRRVVIDIEQGRPPIIHVEQYGDESLLAVIRELDGVEIKREEVASNG